jgi:hypothetical protein
MEYIIDCRSTAMGAHTEPIAYEGGAEKLHEWSAGRTHWKVRVSVPRGGRVLVRDVTNLGNHHCYWLYHDGRRETICDFEPVCFDLKQLNERMSDADLDAKVRADREHSTGEYDYE